MQRLRHLIFCLLLVSLPAPGVRAAEGRPNIVMILADDLGWTDLAFAGSRFYETPHLDALAAGGLRLTSFYASPNCAPTRAAQLTGQYAPRTGVYTVGSLERGEASARRMVPPENRTALPPGTLTVASVLKTAGYATGYLGKWHLGTNALEQPTQLGFDEALVTSAKHLGFVTEPPTELPAGTYLADFLTDRALDFLDRHRDGPFFLHLSHLAVHSPLEAKPAQVARFEKKAPAGNHRDAVYAGMIASLDDSVGRVVAHLEKLGIATNTVVFFTSDNGGVGGYVDDDAGTRRTGVTDNAPLRGGKGMLYEGGIRVPTVVSWPGVVKAGSRSTQPALHVDLFPTWCDLAHAALPKGHAVDGVSLVPLFKDPTAHLRRDAIYWHFPGYLEAYGKPGWRTTPAGAIRAGNFKLIEFFEDDRLELYNLAEDLGEKNNLMRSLPDKTAELRAKLHAWRREMNAPMPTAKALAITPPPLPSPAGVPAGRARP
ncbi:MAG: sulfatase [Verrucomicrobiales bacterium]|nr:sulfatase [Verrucomicrobiales bacterium]